MNEREELERRLDAALGALPAPDEDAGERARRAALGALPASAFAPARPGWRRGGLMGAAAAATVALTAGLALAATGNLDVRVGGAEPVTAPAPEPASERIALPSPLRGLAVLAGSELVVAGRDGFRLEARASAAELSPNALYVAVGLGESLVALAPDGREAWSHEAGGPVVAAAWSPNPLPILIAYVVRRGERHELWLIEGDGDRARRVDADVAPVRPAWRADVQALAYVADDGRLRIRDRLRGRTLTPGGCPRDVTALAYAPSGERLALVGEGGRLGVLGRPGAPGAVCLPRLKGPVLTDVAWLSPTELVTAERAGPGDDEARLRRFAAGPAPGAIVPRGTLSARADLLALAPLPPGVAAGGLAVLARPEGAPGRLAVWLADAPPAAGDRPLRPRTTPARLDAPAGPGPRALSAQ